MTVEWQDIYIDYEISVPTGNAVATEAADQRWFISASLNGGRGGSAIYAAGPYSEIHLLDRKDFWSDGDHVVVVVGHDIALFNDGTIAGDDTIKITGDSVTIVNTWRIFANFESDAVAVTIRTSPDNVTRFDNQGDIAGDHAIRVVSGRLDLHNGSTGRIFGDIVLSHGADSIVSPGTIIGAVRAGGGADIVDATGGVLAGAVHGGRGADRLTGGSLGDRLKGNSGDDILDGGGGGDILEGGRGADTFAFRVADGAPDRVMDFDIRMDAIRLDSGALAGLEPGALAASAFELARKADDADDRVLYDDRTGLLRYDANGSEAGGVVKIAKLAPGLELSHHDFDIA